MHHPQRPSDIEQAALDGIVAEALRPVAGGLAALFVIFAAGRMVVLAGTTREVMVCFALGSSLVLAAIAFPGDAPARAPERVRRGA